MKGVQPFHLAPFFDVHANGSTPCSKEASLAQGYGYEAARYCGAPSFERGRVGLDLASRTVESYGGGRGRKIRGSCVHNTQNNPGSTAYYQPKRRRKNPTELCQNTVSLTATYCGTNSKMPLDPSQNMTRPTTKAPQDVP